MPIQFLFTQAALIEEKKLNNIFLRNKFFPTFEGLQEISNNMAGFFFILFSRLLRKRKFALRWRVEDICSVLFMMWLKKTFGIIWELGWFRNTLLKYFESQIKNWASYKKTLSFKILFRQNSCGGEYLTYKHIRTPYFADIILLRSAFVVNAPTRLFLFNIF